MSSNDAALAFSAVSSSVIALQYQHVTSAVLAAVGELLLSLLLLEIQLVQLLYCNCD
jgi:hypothetical protein